MNRDDITRMAREAGFSEVAIRTPQDLECFAALVAAAERETVKTYYEMSDEHINKVIQAAVVAEREACARLLEDYERFGDTRDCVAAIRARSEK